MNTVQKTMDEFMKQSGFTNINPENKCIIFEKLIDTLDIFWESEEGRKLIRDKSTEDINKLVSCDELKFEPQSLYRLNKD